MHVPALSHINVHIHICTQAGLLFLLLLLSFVREEKEILVLRRIDQWLIFSFLKKLIIQKALAFTKIC